MILCDLHIGNVEELLSGAVLGIFQLTVPISVNFPWALKTKLVKLQWKMSSGGSLSFPVSFAGHLLWDDFLSWNLYWLCHNLPFLLGFRSAIGCGQNLSRFLLLVLLTVISFVTWSHGTPIRSSLFKILIILHCLPIIVVEHPSLLSYVLHGLTDREILNW